MTNNTLTGLAARGSTDEAADAITAAGRLMQTTCYTAGAKWHINPATGQPYTSVDHDERFPLYIALIHSELSEALEGHRRSRTDDHLPHLTMAEAELADVVIRAFNVSGAMGFDLGAAIAAKLRYNATRVDHSPAARQASNGKKY